MKRGWQTKKLGDVCRFIDYRGKTPQKTTSGLRLVTAKNVKMGYLQEMPREYVAPKSYDGWMTRGIPKMGDVLFTTEAPLANVAQLDTEEKVVFAQRIIVLQPSEDNLDRTFLKYLLLSDLAQHRIHEKGTGATVKGIKASLLKSIPIEFPPLPEQQRIVGSLDEAFEGITTAKANAEKNLHNTRALFESHLQTVFTRRGEGWVERKFEDVCHKITDGTHHSPQKQFSERGPERFPYITSKNIRNNYMDLSNVAYIERAFHDEVYARCQPRLGDVLLTKDGANTGTVTLNTLDEPFSLLSSVCLIKTNQAVLRPAFLCYYLQSSTGLNGIVGQMTGAAIKRIVLKDIKKAAIPFPPLKEQDNIVTTLNSLLAETQRLESIYQQKLAALAALKKSLLHQAFSGEL